MTIKTLTHIHNLLIEEKNRKEKALDIIRKAMYEAEENNAPNLQTLKNTYEKMRESYREADYAFDDFENHEWR